jgi:hypothetical protein
MDKHIIKQAFVAGQRAQLQADTKRLEEKLKSLQEVKGIGEELHKRIVAHFAKE